ncbi:MAG: phosphotransferase [Candidatus Acidiferrales bacterium]
MSDREHLLSGGNVAGRVVRIGMTVRKPATSATSSIEAFLEHLHKVGFTGAPRTFGRDELGRHILEYIPGSTVDASQLLSECELVRVSCLIREFHTAAESFVAPARAKWNVVIKPNSESLICHHDLAPWNLVRDGNRWVFIDWDGTGPGSPLWDLAYAAQSFIPLVPGGKPELDAARLRSFVDGYGLDRSQREELPQLIADHTRAMHRLLVDGALTGRQPWARLHAEGHADHWGQSADYIQRHLIAWKHALLDSSQSQSQLAH